MEMESGARFLAFSILYRNTQDDGKTTMNFMSNAFFSQMFQSKMKAVFACTIEMDDETSFISKYMTHVRGIKFEVVL